MSVFLAVDLDAPVRAFVTERITALSTPRGRWLTAEKLHCTLVFLGNLEAEGVALIIPSIDALAARHRPGALRLQGAGTFATARTASVLWLGVEGELDWLRALQLDAARTLRPADSERPFVPHVTLARAKKNESLDDLVPLLEPLRSPGFVVSRLTLYESTHDHYRVIAASPLTQL